MHVYSFIYRYVYTHIYTLKLECLYIYTHTHTHTFLRLYKLKIYFSKNLFLRSISGFRGNFKQSYMALLINLMKGTLLFFHILFSTLKSKHIVLCPSFVLPSWNEWLTSQGNVLAIYY